MPLIGRFGGHHVPTPLNHTNRRTGARQIPTELKCTKDDLYKNSENIRILQDINQASLIGTVQQLNMLSSYANEIFKNLLVASHECSERITGLADRANAVVNDIPPIETKVAAEIQSGFLFVPENKFRALEQRHVTKFNFETRNLAMDAQYDSIEFAEDSETGAKTPRTPAFEEFDALLSDNVKEQYHISKGTRRGFSFPEYFIEKWFSDQWEKQQVIKPSHPLLWKCPAHVFPMWSENGGDQETGEEGEKTSPTRNAGDSKAEKNESE